MGWILRIHRTRETILIPFVCQQCGKCCREVSVVQGIIQHYLPQIAEWLDLSEDQVIKTYLGQNSCLDDDGAKWISNKPMRPCTFLEGNRCIVYPARPEPCKDFPLFTEGGDCGIDCPAKSECARAFKKLTRGIPGRDLSKHQGAEAPRTHIEPKNWDRILRKYISANPSKRSVEVFSRLNKPTDTN